MTEESPLQIPETERSFSSVRENNLIYKIKKHLPSFFLSLSLLIGLIPQSGDNPLMLVPFLVLAIALILSNSLPKIDTTDKTLLLVLALWLVWGISGLFSITPFPSKITWLIFGTLPVTYLWCRTYKDISLTPALITSGLVLAGYTIYEFLNGVSRPNGPFDDANLLGIFLAFAAIPLTNIQLENWRVPKAILQFTGLIVILSALIMTESRTALLAVLAGTILFHIFKPDFSLSKLFKNKWVWSLDILIIALLLPLILITNLDDRIINTIEQSTGRLSLWDTALSMTTISPLTGLGVGTFHLHYPAFRQAGDDSLGFMVHMEPLQFAVESGWLAPILLYALFIFGFYSAYKNKAALPASILGVLFVSMHLTYPLHVVAFLILFGYALSRTCSYPLRGEGQDGGEIARGGERAMISFSILITLLLTIYLSISAAYTFLLWKDLKTAAHLHNQSRFSATLAACLDQGDPDFPDCRIMAARFMTLSQQYEEKDINDLLDKADKANPLNAEIPFLRARHLQIKDPNNTSDIIRLLNDSLNRNPSFWKSREMLVKIMLSEGHIKTAREILDKGLIYPYTGSIRDQIKLLNAQVKALENGH